MPLAQPFAALAAGIALMGATCGPVAAQSPALAPALAERAAADAPAERRAEASVSPRPAELPPLFDPRRHMSVAEVRPGMKGYGLSVFEGTHIERFDVEVVSVLKNFNPRYDVVLIRCFGDYLQHTGAIAGMSGSPIYLTDDAGRSRMIGAFAYGWPWMKDPIAGVQPIEYMLALGSESPPVEAEAPPKREAPAGPPKIEHRSSGPRGYWSLSESGLLSTLARGRPARPELALQQAVSSSTRARAMAGAGDIPRLEPLATPLMASGLSAEAMELLAPAFRMHGLVPLQAGGGAGGAGARGAGNDETAAPLEPGSVLAAPLLTGDVELTAVGTCTEVLGDRVFGFGHPFNNEGPVALPFGSGKVNAVLAQYNQSFKLGSLGAIRGTLNWDQTVGVAGRLGKAPETVPIEFTVSFADAKPDRPARERVYRFQGAKHQRLTPLIALAALNAALTSLRELPPSYTLDYDLHLTFENGHEVRIRNTDSSAIGAGGMGLGLFFAQVGLPMRAALENPFEPVMLRQVTGAVKVTPQARLAELLSANLPRQKYRPGETLTAYVSYRPFRGEEAVMPVALQLPRNLPDGSYQLVISDWERYLSDDAQAQPSRFSAENVQEMFAVLREVTSIRHDALYVRLVRQADGVAVGRVAMPRLPSSHRQVLLGSGRTNTVPYVSSIVKTLPTDLLISGAADFQITIDSEARVEVAGQPPAPRSPQPSVPLPKTEEAKPKPARPETPTEKQDDAPADKP